MKEPMLYHLRGGGYLVVPHGLYVTLNPGEGPQGYIVDEEIARLERTIADLKRMAAMYRVSE
jgi:hypothetical protein